MAEAEEFAEEDKKLKDGVDARNALESYTYSLKSTLDGALKEKVSEEDKAALTAAVDETNEWLDSNPAATKDEADEKRKALEEIAGPIVAKAYEDPGADGAPGAGADGLDEGYQAGDDDGGPTVEEARPRPRKKKNRPQTRARHSTT